MWKQAGRSMAQTAKRAEQPKVSGFQRLIGALKFVFQQ
jgi:hypothetical protein